MGLKDLIVTPVYLILFTGIAYFIRPYVTNVKTKKYFLPALWVRFAGAIALGLIYQFYYEGGDTFNYWEQACVINEAFSEDQKLGVKLLLSNGSYEGELYTYISRIYWFRAPSEYLIIKLVGFFSLFTFKTYLATSLFFAFFSFGGSWAMFSVLQKKFAEMDKWLAVSLLFIPSCIFWGSGILKDTVTLGSLGFLFWGINQIIDRKKLSFFSIMIVIISAWIIFKIKIYILLCLIPSVFIWWYLLNVKAIRNKILRIILIPFFFTIFFGGGFLILEQIASTSDRYNLDSIARWSYITSYDIRYYTGKNAGSGYDIGFQDGSWQTLLSLAPEAVNVSLFRPYIWEVQNPLMLLSALEALALLFLTIQALIKIRQGNTWRIMRVPVIGMMIIFSLTFAFAVGVSTYNFGTLSRYKIPFLPFYVSAILILTKWNPTQAVHKSLNSA